MGKVLVFALLAAWNPLLLAVVPVMLVSARPKRLMLGYLLGAYSVSIAFGLWFGLATGGSSAARTTEQSVNPAVQLILGAIALLAALALAFGWDKRLRRDGGDKEVKEASPPRWQRALDKGSVPLAFAVGALFTLPGGRYIVALQSIVELELATGWAIAAVVVVNLILLALVELPLLSYVVAEEWTPTAVDRARAWFSRNGRRVLVVALAFIGCLLVVRGVVALLG